MPSILRAGLSLAEEPRQYSMLYSISNTTLFPVSASSSDPRFTERFDVLKNDPEYLTGIKSIPQDSFHVEQQ
jgi:hypothetical protein